MASEDNAQVTSRNGSAQTIRFEDESEYLFYREIRRHVKQGRRVGQIWEADSGKLRAVVEIFVREEDFDD